MVYAVTIFLFVIDKTHRTCEYLYIGSNDWVGIFCELEGYGKSLSYSNLRQWRTQEFVQGVGSTKSVEDRGQRERGSGGSSPLVRGSGGSCNLVQEILFHMVKFS